MTPSVLTADSRIAAGSQEPPSSVKASVAIGLAGGDVGQQPAPGALVRAGQQGRGGQHGAGQVRPAVQRGAELLQHDRLLGEAEATRRRLSGMAQALQAELALPACSQTARVGPRSAVHQARAPGTSAPGPLRKRLTEARSSSLLRTHTEDHLLFPRLP